MIAISADECFWYDILAILSIKAESGSEDKVAEFHRVYDEMCAAIGPLHKTVLESPEYAELLAVNRTLFDIIDNMKSPDRPENVCYDVAVDGLNYTRYLRKRALQDKFFPDSPQRESKIGYEKVEGGK